MQIKDVTEIKPGDIAIFRYPENGCKADRAYVKHLGLVPEQELTVKNVEVNPWESSVWLDGVMGTVNTVFFDFERRDAGDQAETASGCSDAIGKALDFDPIAAAETVTGESYKYDQATIGLGFMLHMEHNQAKGDLLRKNGDTRYGITIPEFLELMKEQGFELAAEGDIEYTDADMACGRGKDKWRMFWHRDGLLLFTDSYYGDTKINSGSLYFSTRRSSVDAGYPSRASGGYDSKLWKAHRIPVFTGYFDIREGMRYQLNCLRRDGTFEKGWIRKYNPFLWLLHYGDTKAEDYDHKAITAARLNLLPVEAKIVLGVD